MKKITLLLLVTFSFLFITNSFAQQATIDSLKQEITSTQHDTSKVLTLNRLSDRYINLNNDTSLIYANQALKLATALSYKEGIAGSYFMIGKVYSKQYNADAILMYNKAIKLALEIDDLQLLLKSYGSLANYYIIKANYNEAFIQLDKALKISETLDDNDAMVKLYSSKGRIYSNLGDNAKALQCYNQVLKINEDNKSDNSGLFTNIGIIHLNQGNNGKALSFFDKAIESANEYNNESVTMYIFNMKGILYDIQGNLDKSLLYFNKAIVIAEKYGNIGMASGLYGNCALIYSNTGEYNKAIEYCNKELETAIKFDLKSSIASSYEKMANIYEKQNMMSEAYSYHRKSIDISTQIGDKLGYITSYVNMSRLFLEGSNTENISNLDSAIIYADKSLYSSKEILARREMTYAYRCLSRAYWGLGKNKETLNNLDHLIELDNRNITINFAFVSEKEKENIFSMFSSDYSLYNSFALEYKEIEPIVIEAVFNYTIRNKGLLLKSNTAMRNAIYSSNDSSLIKEYDNWISLKKQIASKYSQAEDASILENKADSVEGYLVKNSNEFSNFKITQNISWKQVQTNLKENEVAIEFTHFPLMNPDSSYTEFTNQTQYVALILTKKNNPKMIPLFEEKQLEQIIGKFGGNNYSYINSIYGKNTEVNKELYNLIWKPMEESLKGAQKVYLSPSGLLHKISFSAIAKDQNVYLCDVYNIEVKSSTIKITEQENNNQKMTTATLFGGITYDTDSTSQKIWSYLEGTKTETQKINKILKKGKVDVNYFSTITATEKEFKLMASSSNILHIATHGFFYPDPKEVKEEVENYIEVGEITFRGGDRGFGVNSFVENQNPLMRSGLVFAGANDVWSSQSKNDSIDDGVLTAQEVANIDMRKTNLVVMSACETGLGDIKGSEGVYGLQRAFKMAGVDYMIMSLWQVPDKETEEFMTSFYKKLIKQKDIKKAFAKTQKEMRTKYDPYFWGAFVLIE